MEPIYPRTNHPHRGKPTIASWLATVAGLFTLLWIASNPALAIGVLGAIAGAMLLVRYGLPKLLGRIQRRSRQLRIPGVGTIEYRPVP